jgi:hypothetical protein
VTLSSKLFNFFFKSEKQIMEDYLAKSVDLVDLERRQRLLNRQPNMRIW